jgi:hypothetical protein
VVKGEDPRYQKWLTYVVPLPYEEL